MKNRIIPQVYSVDEAAQRLNVCSRTIRRHIDWFLEHCRDSMIVREHPKRNFYYFTEASLQQFATAHGRHLAEPRTKRAYYKRIVKGQHTKKRGRKK